MKKKLLLISQENILGITNGATKMLYYFANNMAERGYDIVVCYPNKENAYEDKNLNKSVSFYNLNYVDIANFRSKRRIFSFADLFIKKRCKKAIETIKINELSNKMEYVIEKEKPDVIITFFMHVTCQLTLGKKYDIPIIQMYHTYPEFYHKKVNPFDKKTKDMAILFNHCVKSADKLQLFFPSYEEYINKTIKANVSVIHNPVIIDGPCVDLTVEKKKIVYLSRVDKNKGQNILIDSFALIANAFPDWEVLIYGDFEPKEYKKIILSQILKNKLAGQVKLMGVTENVQEVLHNADIGAYTSFYEGFPLGLSEALSAGLPCIGLASATGINELIINEYNGFLCDTEPLDIAMKLVKLMDNQDLRIEYGKNARESVKKYSPESFFEKWDNAIDEVIKRKKLWRF